MKSTKLKKSQGITLIALVVTIVVLLILAGITINMLFSENGIITKAKEAAEKTAEAEENEIAGMQGVVDQIDSILQASGENKEPSESDPTFPYGTVYRNGIWGLVIHENGVGEIVIIGESNQIVIRQSSGTGQYIIEGNVIKIGEDEGSIAEDYSSITDNDVTLIKTDIKIEYCEHQWKKTEDNEENSHQCLKCEILGIHSNVDLSGDNSCKCETTCTGCGYQINISWEYKDEEYHYCQHYINNLAANYKQEAHNDSDNDGYCDVCSYQTVCEHEWLNPTPGGMYHSCEKCGEEQEHSYEPMSPEQDGHYCTECPESEMHSYDSEGYCSKCQYFCDHTNSISEVEYINNYDGTHQCDFICSNCGKEITDGPYEHEYEYPDYSSIQKLAEEEDGRGIHGYLEYCECGAYQTVATGYCEDSDNDGICDECNE